MLSGRVKAKLSDRAYLTISEDVILVGAITKDNESYRLRSKSGSRYSLVEINQRNLPEFDYVVAYTNDKPSLKTEYEHGNGMKEKPSPIDFKEYVEDQLNIADNLFWLEDGARIDILIAHSSFAADWAQRNGLDIEAEIVTLIAKTINALTAFGLPHYIYSAKERIRSKTTINPVQY